MLAGHAGQGQVALRGIVLVDQLRVTVGGKHKIEPHRLGAALLQQELGGLGKPGAVPRTLADALHAPGIHIDIEHAHRRLNLAAKPETDIQQQVFHRLQPAALRQPDPKKWNRQQKQDLPVEPRLGLRFWLRHGCGG